MSDVLKIVLTIPDQGDALRAAQAAPGSSGQGALIDSLEKSPLAISERGHPRGMDHVHLSRFDGTDFCQWMGRCADGYHRPIGRIMQMVRTVEVHERFSEPNNQSTGGQ